MGAKASRATHDAHFNLCEFIHNCPEVKGFLGKTCADANLCLSNSLFRSSSALITHQDTEGFTALHWAVIFSNMDAIRLLLRYDAQRCANCYLRNRPETGLPPLPFIPLTAYKTNEGKAADKFARGSVLRLLNETRCSEEVWRANYVYMDD